MNGHFKFFFNIYKISKCQKDLKKKKKNQRTMRKNEKTFIQGKKNIETKRNSNRKKMTKGGWWQFCHSPSTDTIMPVFSPFQRDRIFVGSGKKFLDLANFFFFFSPSYQTTHKLILSFIFHQPYFTYNKTYPKGWDYKFLLFLTNNYSALTIAKL